MTEKIVDIKQLIFLICDQKELEVNLNLDEGCTFETDDPKPLVKVINYLLNYLDQLTDRAVEVSLDLRPLGFRLSMLAYTTIETVPEISTHLQDALNDYNASFKMDHKTGIYVQTTILFGE